MCLIWDVCGNRRHAPRHALGSAVTSRSVQSSQLTRSDTWWPRHCGPRHQRSEARRDSVVGRRERTVPRDCQQEAGLDQHGGQKWRPGYLRSDGATCTFALAARDAVGWWPFRQRHMATAQAGVGHRVFAVLDVVLRVPCIFIIDAIFNSYYDAGSGWAGAVGKLLIRSTGKTRHQEHGSEQSPLNRPVI